MHYAFALVAAFLATAVVASPHVKHEYKTVTVYHTRHGSHRWWRHKYHKKPSKESDPSDIDSTDRVQRYDDFPKPGMGSSGSNYYGRSSREEDSSEEKEEQPSKEKSPTSGGSSSGSGSLEDSCLKVHNEKRAIHGAGPLKWDNTLANHAQGVSNTCQFKHSGDSYGENLAAGYQSAALAIEAWYDEVKDYSYSKGDFDSSTGHFTQMVWKSATKLGCAIHTCNGSGGTPGDFLTCNYDTGNVIGEFTANVLPPGGK